MSINTSKTKLLATRLKLHFKKNSKIYQIFLWSIFFVVTFLYYVFVNWQHSGPVYVNDELGYLSKAFAIAGFGGEGTTSWHAGYSFLLAPLARLFSDPVTFWKSLILLNSALFVASLFLLKNILQKLFPKKPTLTVFAAVFVTAIYPAWVTMVGYAFPTPIFVFILTLTAYLLVVLNLKKAISIIIISILSGLLYWVHPIGLAFAAATMFVLVIQAIKDKKYINATLVCLLILSTVILYAKAVHPWLNGIMTSDLVEKDSGIAYGFIANNISLVTLRNFLARVPVYFMGELSYLIIGTLGVIASAFYVVFKSLKKLLTTNKKLTNIELVLLILVLSVIGSIAIGVLTFYLLSLSAQGRPDHLVYGRYIDMCLLPLLGICILMPRKIYYSYALMFILIMAGLILNKGIDILNIDFANYDFIHTPALWPIYFITEVNYIEWIILGAIGVVAGLSYRKSIIILILIPLVFVSVQKQQQWHEYRHNFARPTGLVDFVNDTLVVGDCVGFYAKDARQDQQDRIELYKYYLAKYSPKKMDYDSWLKSNCVAFITNEKIMDANVDGVSVSREQSSGLYVLSKEKTETVIDTSGYKYRAFYANNNTNNNVCSLVQMCFDRSAEEIKDFVLNGVFESNYLMSNGSLGTLVFGPYVALENGEYNLIINSKISDPAGVIVELTSVRSKISEIIELGSEKNGEYIVPFKMPIDVKDFEVKININTPVEIKLYSYRIESRIRD